MLHRASRRLSALCLIYFLTRFLKNRQSEKFSEVEASISALAILPTFHTQLYSRMGFAKCYRLPATARFSLVNLPNSSLFSKALAWPSQILCFRLQRLTAAGRAGSCRRRHDAFLASRLSRHYHYRRAHARSRLRIARSEASISAKCLRKRPHYFPLKLSILFGRDGFKYFSMARHFSCWHSAYRFRHAFSRVF